MQKSSIGLAAIATLVSVGHASAQVEGNLALGFDDNPFRLSDAFDAREAGFADVEARWRPEFGGGFSADVRAGAVTYGGDAEDANQTTYSAQLRYEVEQTLLGLPTEHQLQAKYSGVDKTFVSRSTGVVGVFGGQEIEDRFDSQGFDGRYRADLDLSDTVFLRVQLEGRSRTYEDYSALGLSNLDYTQYRARTRLRFRPNDSHDVQLNALFGRRVFDDRRVRDLNGAFIANSDMEWEFVEIGGRWKFEFADKQDIQLSYGHAMRSDNEAGYYDTATNEVSLRYRNRAMDANKFSAEIGYVDLDFENISDVQILNNEEAVGPKQGPRFKVEYERTLIDNGDNEVAFVVSAIHEDFDSLNADFEFDRSRILIGIEAAF